MLGKSALQAAQTVRFGTASAPGALQQLAMKRGWEKSFPAPCMRLSYVLRPAGRARRRARKPRRRAGQAGDASGIIRLKRTVKQMPIQVKSEVTPLKRVLLHRPGQELEHIVPDTLERLLFDDIPYLRGAQREHDYFAQILREHGVTVTYLEDAVAETLDQDPALKEQFIQDFIRSSSSFAWTYAREIRDYLLSLPTTRDLVLKTMAGVPFNELSLRRANSLHALLSNDSQFVLDPIPNLYFTRDPFASIGCGASVHHMYSSTRRRETIYGRYILQYHPDFAGRVPFYYDPEEPYSIEGGDILNLSERVLAVGISQRTMPEAIEQLARRIFSDETAQIETILAISIPRIRAFMHLDTVLTQVGHGKFLMHPGILHQMRLFELRRAERGELRVREVELPFRQALAHYLQRDDITLIYCGGGDRIASQREQWNDGANTLCVSPDVVVTYDRNYVTNQILADCGIQTLKIPSSELSRGRGGPRCMSMPLIREDG